MKKNQAIELGDYVIATKYSGGSTQDAFCVGFYGGTTKHAQPRHLVVDGDGNQFRHNGFRRVSKISKEKGALVVANIPRIEQSRYSIWWWYRRSMATLTKLVVEK